MAEAAAPAPLDPPPLAGPSLAVDPRPAVHPAALRADCSRCAGLCCVVPAFARSADFAVDKPAGVPCLHLAGGPEDFGCTIHDELRPRGFPGCTTYDCFGAGQLVVQHTFGGTTWQQSPEAAAEMFAVFSVVRPLQELLWLVTEAVRLPAAVSVRDELTRAGADLDRLVHASVPVLLSVDVDEQRAAVVPLLRGASELARAGIPGADLSGADLVGRRLVDLRGASLRGALLLGADLRAADLHRADVTGADLRSADVRGTDLSSVLFLSQQQVDAARGDDRTSLPDRIGRPSHWRRTGGA